MRFKKQAKDIPIKNFDLRTPGGKKRTKRHGTLLPDTLRCIIAGIIC